MSNRAGENIVPGCLCIVLPVEGIPSSKVGHQVLVKQAISIQDIKELVPDSTPDPNKKYWMVKFQNDQIVIVVQYGLLRIDEHPSDTEQDEEQDKDAEIKYLRNKLASLEKSKDSKNV